MKPNVFCLCVASVFLSLSACTSLPEPAESSTAAVQPLPSTDVLSGTWSGDWGPTAQHRNPVTLDLKWDGTNLSGAVNPGPTAIQLSKASFDSGTGAVLMEADARNHEGNTVHYMIEGKVEGNSIAGTWNHQKQKGDFKVTRQ